MRHVVLALLFLCTACGVSEPRDAVRVAERPVIYPDYTDLVLPPNIAPLSFVVRHPNEGLVAALYADGEFLFAVSSGDSILRMPADRWRSLAERGGAFQTVVYTKNKGKWSRYEPFENTFSTDSIDRYLSYRLIAPGYELWSDMGIYQRDLSSFDQQAILTNTATGTGCMNCHTFADHSAQTAMLHFRGKKAGTLIKRNGKVTKHTFKTPEMLSEGTYSSFHPSGRYIAFSTNIIDQFFHISGDKPIEVSDQASDLVVYDVERNMVLADSLVFGTQYLETFPEWSSDGRKIYFTRASGPVDRSKMDSIYYDLCSVDFDAQSGTFSNVEVLVASSLAQKSISFPRVAGGGRYLVYTLSDYGNFSIWHSESDLWLYDIQIGVSRRMDELNSSLADSYHSFSSNGRWIVVSSRRDDGLYTRPYLAHFDPVSGRFSKPFVMPASSPDFYREFFYSYNLPEFTRDRFEDRRAMLDVALSDDKYSASFRMR